MDTILTIIFLLVMVGVGLRGLPFWAWVHLVHEYKRRDR